MEIPEDLTTDQLQALHASLLMARKDLTSLIEMSASGTKPVELDQSSVGRLSRMDAMQVQQMAKASRRNYELRLRQVEQALRLIERDEYGTCRSCEEPIGFPRLSARPESPFCLQCQGVAERRR